MFLTLQFQVIWGKILLHMQIMGHGVLFMDEYNPINIHIGG
jgi:hypothetical protein